MKKQYLEAMKPLHLAVTAVLALGVTSASAQIVSEFNGPAGQVPSRGPAGVLYDQINNPTGNGVPDQDFEAAYNGYDSDAADDFMVPFGVDWMVEETSSAGTQSAGGTATSVNVTFYRDSGGAPGAVQCSYSALTPVETAGSYVITLPTPCALPGNATYWYGQQSVQDFTGGANGQHFWSGRTMIDGSEAVWRNPLDGFGTGCTTFMPAGGVCGVGGGGNFDLQFALAGTVGLAVIEPIPTLNWTGVLMLTLGLGLVGAFGVRRRQNIS